MKSTVALIYGGEGYEHEISCISANNIRRLLDHSKYEVIPVIISKSGEWFIEKNGEKTPTFPAYISGVSGLYCVREIIPVDLAIPALHGDLGEDGVIMGALRASHIKYVGCDVLAGAVCSDKIVTKMIADAARIPTAKWTYFDGENATVAKKQCESLLQYPLFIKPAPLGSSIGISCVTNSADFCDAYNEAVKFHNRILVEEAVARACELECAYLEIGKREDFAVGKVISGGKFYDFNGKYDGSTKTEATFTEKKIRDVIVDMSKRLRSAAGISQISRFDFFLTVEGKILFNEINTFPGMTPTSLYPELTLNMGLSEGEFINRLCDEALL